MIKDVIEEEYCCGCYGCPDHGHDCGLSPEQIAENERQADELMAVYMSLKPGERKWVPSRKVWASYEITTNPAGNPCRTYKLTDKE